MLTSAQPSFMDNSQLIKHSQTWDRTGVFVASLCLVHCLAFPVVIALLPASKLLLNNPWLEITILGLGIIIGSVSFITSFRRHRKIYPIILGLLGVAFLASNLVFFSEAHDHSHGTLPDNWLASLPVQPLMILGGLFLITGHLGNIHACHCFCDTSCGHKHDDEADTHHHHH